MKKPFVIISPLALLLAACGGGGGGGSSPSPTPTPAPASSAGFWVGSTNTSRSVNAVTLTNGEYWAIYTVPGNNTIAAGFIQGNAATSGTHLSSSNGRDFNFEGDGVLAATISGSFVEKTSISLTAIYPTLAQTVITTGTFNIDYNTTPSLATIAGNYGGEVASAAGAGAATATISAAGVLTGSSGGCQMSGTLKPHETGNVYDVLVTFGPSPCLLSNTQTSGIAYFDSTTHYIYAAVIDSGRNNGLLFIGPKL